MGKAAGAYPGAVHVAPLLMSSSQDHMPSRACLSRLLLSLVQGKILIRLHEIASGMSYLHSRSVLHGDLKVGFRGGG